MAAQHGRDMPWWATCSHQSTCISARHHGLPNISTTSCLGDLLLSMIYQTLGDEGVIRKKLPRKARGPRLGSAKCRFLTRAQFFLRCGTAPTHATAGSKTVLPMSIPCPARSLRFSSVSLPTAQSPAFAESMSAEVAGLVTRHGASDNNVAEGSPAPICDTSSTTTGLAVVHLGY
jgi:hypothetical protein